MSSRKSFRLSTNKAAKNEYPPIELDFEDLENPDGDPVTLTAIYPGDGLIMLAVGDAGDEDSETNAVSAIMSILRGALSAEDFKTLRSWIRSGAVEPEMLAEIVEDLLGTWSTFPTQPSSGSRQSGHATGTRSTGRARGKGSTQEISPPTGS